MLSQSAMDRVGTAAAQMYGSLMEAITYQAQATATAPATAHAVRARFRAYRLTALTPEAILPTDQECRIPTSAVTWTPAEHDLIERADRTVWRVLSLRDGCGHPWWKLQVRQVG